jgi:hypothetical protein
MKLVKSLLLGSAAGLVAIAGAQAADLPVKAKPVEYVKVCSAYGAGFYYIPGTDICLRVGGYVFIEAGYNARAGVPIMYSYNNAAVADDRNVNRTNFRTRGDIILDARAQTAIGTVRTYISIGQDYNNNLAGAPPPGVVTAYLERAFIQFAGFTAGQAATFFDFGAFYSIYGLASIAWDWRPVFAYTAQFGNGLSATISIEDGQAARTKIRGFGIFVPPFTATSAYGGQSVPDIVGNLRVDQAWGSAQVSGVLHQLRLSQTQIVTFPLSSDTYGWAVLGGIEIKTPSIAPGDSIMLQGVWSRGAVEYTGLASSPLAVGQGIGYVNPITGVGPSFDVFDSFITVATGQNDLTVAWSANLMYRHFWQPNLRSAIWVGYNRIEPQGNAVTLWGNPASLSITQVGGNVIWSPAPTLDLSLDVLWTKLETGACGGTSAGAIAAATCNQSADFWSVWTRWRRNF